MNIIPTNPPVDI